MTFELLYDGNVYRYVAASQAPTVNPIPVSIPEGTETRDGSDYGVELQDYDVSERGSDLPETNATQPDRPVDWNPLTGWRVSPQGKITLAMDKGTGPTYWQMFVDFCGAKNADTLLVDGNGYFDTASHWGFMCSPSGGDLQHIVDEIYQSGWYDIVERFDYSVKPVRMLFNGVRWYYQGREVSYALTPHLFNCRTNRRKTTDIRWITSGGINNVSWAQAGRETWPLVANKKAAQPRAKISRYPALPRKMQVCAESLVVDGNLVSRESVEMWIDAYRFRGSDTFVHNPDTDNWYKGDEMLARATEPFSASALDYRCYVSHDGRVPWMGVRGYRSPVPNWQRV